MHDHLKKQLLDYKLSATETPEVLQNWQDFLESIEASFKDMDQERFLAERSLAASSRELTERWAESHRSNQEKKQSIQFLRTQNRLLEALSGAPSFVEFMGLFLEECLSELNISSGSVFQLTHENLEFLTSNGKGDATSHIRWVLQQSLDQPIIAPPHWLVPIRKPGQPPFGCLNFDIKDIPPDPGQVKFLEGLISLAVIAYEKDLAQQNAEDEHIKVISSSKKAALGDMAGGIAHEINNPLAIISMTVQKLKILNARGPISQTDLAKDLNKVEKTVTRVSAIIKALRAFSRDDKSVAKQNDDLGRILQETLTLCSEKIKNSGIEIRNRITKDDALSIFCNPVQISQVLLNLISNSFDAIEGSESPWMEFSIQKDSGRDDVTIVISDSGSGIPKSVREKMMLPFFTTKEVGKGTGVGLSLCLGIAKDHGGSLVYDEASKNTEFHLTLPKSKPATLSPKSHQAKAN